MAKMRVAAYCRISTNKEVQQSSLELQTQAFEERIRMNPNWELVKVYADEGLSGTSAKSRVQFQHMIQDAMDGSIDYILAKSISRFARNTVDALNYTRMLKEKGVGVFFEEQNLDTMNVASEMFLTIYAAFAQEESHSISENQKRGYRNRFALEKAKWAPTYGFVCKEDESWAVNPKEAKTVRRIFDMCVKGKSLSEISAYLEQHKVHPPMGERRWHLHSVASIIHNEKYKGDVELQKTYVESHLTHKKKRNDGKLIPKYYLKNHHPAIVSEEAFGMANRILEMKNTHKGCNQYPYYGTLKCPHCGENMVGMTLKTKGLERAWTCGGCAGTGERRKERTACKPVCVKEKYITNAVKNAFPKKTDSIEYCDLIAYVDSITFAQDSWYQLVIRWKDGQQSIIPMAYERASEIPVEEITVRDGDIFFDGQYIGSGYFDYKSKESVEGIQTYLQEIRIIDTDTVPQVYRPNRRDV